MAIFGLGFIIGMIVGWLTYENKILLIIGLIILTSLTGCKGKEIKSDDEWNYTVVIN